MDEEESPTFTPRYQEHQKKEFNLKHFLDKHASNNELLNLIAFTLLRHLAEAEQASSLESSLTTERAGGGPNVEGALRDTLNRLGNNVNDGVLYGSEVSVDIRERWAEMGIDPDSRDELNSYFSNNNIDHLANNTNSPEQQEQLREYMREHNLTPTTPRPSNQS
jgi:hypothetical protein